MIRLCQCDAADSGNPGTALDVGPSPPGCRIRRRNVGKGNTTYLCQVLPDLLLFLALSFPLLTNDFGNIRVVKARVAGNYGLLVVLPIKNKCCGLCQPGKTFADKGGDPLFVP